MSASATERRSPPLHLWPEGVREEGGSATLSCAIECAGSERERLWYRVPLELRGWLTESCDPFVVATTLLAMRRRADLVAHGQVSPSLLENLVEFQNVWMNWGMGKYRPVELRGEIEREPALAEPRSAAVCGFSGGVDSAFTVLRHRKAMCGRATRDLQAGVLVHGFDIPLEQEDTYARAAGRAEETLRSVGMSLLRVASNHRRLNPEWHETHGVGLASCLMLFAPRFGHGLIASTQGYAELPGPWGSHPISDPMLSSATFRIAHDAGGWARGFKLRDVAAWPEAFRNLRVCYRAARKDENCGRCAKCVITLLALRAQGLGVPASFARDVDDATVLRVELDDERELAFASEFLAEARVFHGGASWLRALARAVAWHERRAALARPARGALAERLRRLRLRRHERRRP